MTFHTTETHSRSIPFLVFASEVSGDKTEHILCILKVPFDGVGVCGKILFFSTTNDELKLFHFWIGHNARAML